MYAKPVLDGRKVPFNDTMEPCFFSNFTFCGRFCGFPSAHMPLGQPPAFATVG
jgi:hypothetical protein